MKAKKVNISLKAILTTIPLTFTLACAPNKFNSLSNSQSQIQSENDSQSESLSSNNTTEEKNMNTQLSSIKKNEIPKTNSELATLEQNIETKLKKHANWAKITFQIDSLKTMGSEYTVPIAVKYSLVQNKLKDISPMSDNLNKVDYDLNQKQIITDIINKDFANITDIIYYKLLSNDAFSFEVGNKKVIFFATKNNPFSSPMKVSFAHFTTQLVPKLKYDPQTGINIGQMLEQPVNYTTILRHDIRTIRKVYVPSHFPKEFIVDLQTVISRWNKSLNKKFYQYAGQQDLDYDECIAQSYLCIDWTGGTELPMSGIGGVSSITYDMENGLIYGGVIGFKNINTDTNLPQLDSQSLNKMNSNDMDTRFQIAAALFLRKDEMLKTKNPFPHEAVQAILIHEMGHDLGLRHYFAGSQHPSQTRFGDTVMDYYPFGAMKSEILVGSRDQTKIDIIYHANAQSFSEEVCGDSDVNLKNNCVAWDLGPTSKWYMSLATQSPDDVDTTINTVGGLTNLFTQSKPTVWSLLSRYMIPDFIYDRSQLPQTWSSNQKDVFVSSIISNYKKDFATQLGINVSESDVIHNFICEPSRRTHLQNIITKAHDIGNDLTFICENNIPVTSK